MTDRRVVTGRARQGRQEPDSIRRVLADRSVLVLSPHPDDAALSVGGLLLTVPNRRTILTVFSHSRWAPLLPVAGHASGQVSAVRRVEDERYAAFVGAARLDAGLPDSSLRHPGMRDWRGRPRPHDPCRVAAERVVAEALRCHPTAAVLCPLALQEHMDHVLVCDATLRHAGGRVVLLYEDLPYATEVHLAAIERAVARLAPAAQPLTVDIGQALSRKLEGVRLYRSQAREWELASVEDHAQRVARAGGHAERVWLLP